MTAGTIPKVYFRVDAHEVFGKGPTPGISSEEEVAKLQTSLAKKGSTTEGMVCYLCRKRVGAHRFRWISRTPCEIDKVCIRCRVSLEEGRDVTWLQAESAERKADRLVKRRAEDRRAQEKLAVRKRNRRAGNKKSSKVQRENNALVTAKTAAQVEVSRRELARRRLLYFTQRFEGYELVATDGDVRGGVTQRHKGGYDAGWVHHDICARLERFYADVKAGLQPRLMLFMPPRHGKSTLVSRMFPSWVFGQDPTMEIIASSYGTKLPNEFSRFVRGMLRDPEYHKVFPTRQVDGETVEGSEHSEDVDFFEEGATTFLVPGAQLDPENQNLEGWGTSAGGRYLPAGIGSGISGRGADIFIVDDPVRDQEAADSETIREKTMDWYKAVANTRLSPRSGVLIILTRWHDDDLAGALVDEQKEFEDEFDELYEVERQTLGITEAGRLYAERMSEIDRWEVVQYPAVAKTDEYRRPSGEIIDFAEAKAKLLRRKGEALHPERYPLSRLNRIKNGYLRKGRIRMWHALYQQEPVPDEGLHFDKINFRYEPLHAPHILHQWTGLQAWDLAIGEKKQHAFTVGVHGELDFDNNIHVTDLRRGRWSDPEEIAEQVLRFYAKHRPNKIGIERTHLEMMLAPVLKKKLASLNKSSEFEHNKLSPHFLEGKDALVPITDKLQRAGILKGMHGSGQVIFPLQSLAPWVELAEREMLRFPAGRFMDIVDSLSWLARMAVNTPAPRNPLLAGGPRNRIKSWKD